MKSGPGRIVDVTPLQRNAAHPFTDLERCSAPAGAPCPGSRTSCAPTGVPEEGLTIEAVSLALGAPAPTIRSWEWRHRLLTERHREDGHRRYTRDDVTALTRMRDETAAERGIAEAAALVAAAVTAPPGQVVDRLLAATHRLHTQSICETLQRSRQIHGLVVTPDEVLLAEQGFECRYLGAQTPVSSLVVTAKTTAGARRRRRLLPSTKPCCRCHCARGRRSPARGRFLRRRRVLPARAA